MDMRPKQIEAVAGIIADAGLTADKARRINADGWTVELDNGRGGWLRYEGVVLSAAEMEQALALAREWA